jgi:hypothetical protein
MANCVAIAGRALIGLMVRIVRAVDIRFPMIMNQILNCCARYVPPAKTN